MHIIVMQKKKNKFFVCHRIMQCKPYLYYTHKHTLAHIFAQISMGSYLEALRPLRDNLEKSFLRINNNFHCLIYHSSKFCTFFKYQFGLQKILIDLGLNFNTGNRLQIFFKNFYLVSINNHLQNYKY